MAVSTTRRPLWPPPPGGTTDPLQPWGQPSPGGGLTDRMPMSGVGTAPGVAGTGWQPPQNAGVSPWGGLPDRMPMTGIGTSPGGDYTNLLPPGGAPPGGLFGGGGAGGAGGYGGDPYYQTFEDPNAGGAWGFQQAPDAFVGGGAPGPGGGADRQPMGGVGSVPGWTPPGQTFTDRQPQFGSGSGTPPPSWGPGGSGGGGAQPPLFGNGIDRQPQMGVGALPGGPGGASLSAGAGQSPADVAAYWGANPQGGVLGMGRVTGDPSGGMDRLPMGGASIGGPGGGGSSDYVGGGASTGNPGGGWQSPPANPGVRDMGRVVPHGQDRQPQPRGNAFGFGGSQPPLQGFIDSMPQHQRDALVQLMNQGYPFEQAYQLMIGQL